jgi:hypothetical protein
MDKLVLLPDSNGAVIWDTCISIAYLISIFLSTSIIAFHMKTYAHFWKQELIMDSVMLVDIILIFFTAFADETENSTSLYNKSLKAII